MKEQLETLKKWVATGQVKTARGRQHDDLLTLIGQMEVALRQTPVVGRSEQCAHESSKISDDATCWVCSDCGARYCWAHCLQL